VTNTDAAVSEAMSKTIQAALSHLLEEFVTYLSPCREVSCRVEDGKVFRRSNQLSE
jgi:hypothetical protein